MHCQTVKKQVSFRGVGVHSGEVCTVRVHPGEPGQGINFLSGGETIPALVESVVACERSTVLGRGGVRVSTVEHLLAAAKALHLSDLAIEVTGPEIPILDGSAKPFWEALRDVGSVNFPGQWESWILDRPVHVSLGDSCILALPASTPILEYALHYPHPLVGYQHINYYPDADDFEKELAGARTFALWEEVQPLLERGMARGGSIENALVVYQDRYSSPLRMEDEPVRHKCMDLLGDLSLFGRPVTAHIVAVRAGHRSHVEFVRKLRQEETRHVGRP